VTATETESSTNKEGTEHKSSLLWLKEKTREKQSQDEEKVHQAP